MKLLIGLTPIVDAGRDSLWMLPGYMQGLEAVGGIGMMLPLTDDAAMLKDIVDRVDGLLLTGGNDVAPVLYGETKETFCGENDPRRDRMEARLIELAASSVNRVTSQPTVSSAAAYSAKVGAGSRARRGRTAKARRKIKSAAPLPHNSQSAGTSSATASLARSSRQRGSG